MFRIGATPIITLVAPADYLALLVWRQLRFPSNLDAPRLRSLSSFAGAGADQFALEFRSRQPVEPCHGQYVAGDELVEQTGGTVRGRSWLRSPLRGGFRLIRRENRGQ
jgi:hypothetical protein